MSDIEFNLSLRPLNRAYRDIFHEIPCIQNYSCTRDEYVAALKKSIETGKPIDTYLVKAVMPQNKDVLI
ncbi:MAG: hypothetical protein K6F71_09860 [Ruminococcus sp.]|uniref:hypothetical protein n=1 Tax=Ruminococcus sp. TaxID=41978 RepID=UPI0025F61089|nr:hypothetical protein [Ruminococcus sp.]MCR5541104.1 hypothetical protein [Ruminococcus sp.]